MWAKLDDALIDHRKVYEAGALIGGKDGPAIAIGWYAVLLMWSAKHLSDGFIPDAVVPTLNHVKNPLVVADALYQVGLLERHKTGFRIHDYHEYNPSARAIRKRRKTDRIRKQRGRNHGTA